MSEREVNQRIMAEIEDLEDDDVREFLKEALAFERSKMDKKQPHYRDTYTNLIEKYAPVEEPDEEDVEDI